ncbi:hypothetical protein GCM10009000_118080 [Halobacterium noricense]
MGHGRFSSTSDDAEIDINHPKHDYLAPTVVDAEWGKSLFEHSGQVAARYLDNSEEIVRVRYSHIEAGGLGDVATEALEEVDSTSNWNLLNSRDR